KMAVGVFVGAGIAGAHVAVMLAAGKRARARRAALGAARDRVDPREAGCVVTLRGRVVAVGAAIRFAGADIAAVTEEAESTALGRRAEILLLEIGDERVVIDGPVRVVVGSRERAPNRKTRHLALVSGDVVRAR